MGYTREQIKRLGIRPRERKVDPETGMHQLLPCEWREVKAVVKDILNDGGREGSDELWQFWRLIPFEEGYACQRRKEYEDWIQDEVENLWYDIGHPVFDLRDNSWSCPAGGWWPYLDREYQDVSWLKVGAAIIDMDEVWSALRNILEERVRGYRMCPGMALYRTVREWLAFEGSLHGGGPKLSAKAADTRRTEFISKIRDLVQDFPTKETRSTEMRTHYPSGYVRVPWKAGWHVEVRG